MRNHKDLCNQIQGLPDTLTATNVKHSQRITSTQAHLEALQIKLNLLQKALKLNEISNKTWT